jgi:hypothetical protein
LGLITEYVPFAVQDFMDEYNAKFKANMEEENITQLRKALLSSGADIAEDNLNRLVARVFVRTAPSELLVQGMIDQVLLSLTWQNEQSGEYVFQRLIDGEI